MEQLQFIPPVIPNTKFMIGVVSYNGKMSLSLHTFCDENEEKYISLFEEGLKTLSEI